MITDTLKGQDFKLNDYASCVVNKIVNGKQCIITWYVDYLKISRMEQAVVDDVIKAVESYFGNMYVTHGENHSYLSIEI